MFFCFNIFTALNRSFLRQYGTSHTYALGAFLWHKALPAINRSALSISSSRFSSAFIPRNNVSFFLVLHHIQIYPLVFDIKDTQPRCVTVAIPLRFATFQHGPLC